jgi:hypothetical protein
MGKVGSASMGERERERVSRIWWVWVKGDLWASSNNFLFIQREKI